ncbi:ADP-ribose pyrophosphatase YjhB (NUDIX family) [Anaeroplasma bactoclasticum]|jgi:8-oxo-dGTP pyrophosphatase MutT (NUDIX family)|uniref:ADP-ribose pyrophosphatase YjhB (NUDIX family) n=1 Tax=Anaeroplasma bactoclasticum TaxID=2088 RepID=A0A397RXK1_9MOLU|nr:NUDIX domain-containing protein [Anaeroplasma bactoclasticum]RIA77992.1 ADP-ribose pyrophosphatase YjhB (NUDIX family) [Anaeroplasma bactoclasticum]
MRTIKLYYDDFQKQIDVLRHASRGIVIKDNKILLTYVKTKDIYMLPGGGKEGVETITETCIRELQEETGTLVSVKDLYLDIEEYFERMCHINHYLICEVNEENLPLKLTKAEIKAKCEPRWVDLNEALRIFGSYPEYQYTNVEVYGLYQREYRAIKEYIRYTNIMDTYNFLKSYKPVNEQEKADLEYMLYMYEKMGDELFKRESLATHFSSSCWITNKDHTKILMNYHNIYKNWGWLGGHNDNDKDFLSVALKEAQEESGLSNIKVLKEEPVSIEVLPVTYHIKNSKFVSSHTHMNVTYLFEADEKEELKIKPDENSGLKWVDMDKTIEITNEEDMKPIYKKLNDALKRL